MYQIDDLQSKLVFEFNADPDPKEPIEDSDEDYDPAGYEVYYCYENELDVLAVLSAESIMPDQEEYGDFHTRIKLHSVQLFDNKTYVKLKSIPLDYCVKLGSTESPQVSLDLDRDVLLIRVKSSAKTRTLVWRLRCENLWLREENDDVSEENDEIIATPSGKRKPPQSGDTITTTLRPTRTSSRRRSKSKNA